MDRLHRELAPITDRAWEEIASAARHVLETNLVGRRIVDVDGPRGEQMAAVDLGRLDDDTAHAHQGVHWGIRRVLPLVEINVPFALARREIDALARGATDVDLDPLLAAARRAAAFEDAAIFNGLSSAGMRGLCEASRHDPLPLGDDPKQYPDTVTLALMRLRDLGVEGPYRLVLGPQAYRTLGRDAEGYPVGRQLERLLEAPAWYSPVLEGGVLVSLRGGDFVLTLGCDMRIGYERVDERDVHLYFTESFTFHAHADEAVVCLPQGSPAAPAEPF